MTDKTDEYVERRKLAIAAAESERDMMKLIKIAERSQLRAGDLITEAITQHVVLLHALNAIRCVARTK